MLKLGTMLATAGVAMLMVPSAQAQADLFGDGMNPRQLQRAIKQAEKHPLGTLKNPVRVNMPPGERLYLSKLRCADGEAPGFERAGNVGIGPYRNIIDLYEVRCTGQAPVEIYMDMYFPENEKRPVPGFTIVE